MPRQRTRIITTPNGTSTWLDLYPPRTTSTSTTQIPPLPPRGRRSPIPAVVARLTALRSALEDIKQSIDVRTHISMIHMHSGRYCLDCSPAQQHTPYQTSTTHSSHNHVRPVIISPCGPTCPLNRPDHQAGSIHDITPDWIEHSRSHAAAYVFLIKEMNARAHEATVLDMRRWEKRVEDLSGKQRNLAEKHEDWGWGRTGRVSSRMGLRPDWRFESWWGTEKREGEMVAPGSRRSSRRTSRRKSSNEGELREGEATGECG